MRRKASSKGEASQFRPLWEKGFARSARSPVKQEGTRAAQGHCTSGAGTRRDVAMEIGELKTEG